MFDGEQRACIPWYRKQEFLKIQQQQQKQQIHRFKKKV